MTSDADRLRAGLDEDEVRASDAGPAYIAWLHLNVGTEGMFYTTVAARHGDWEPWVADGREVPDPASVRVVYDPAQVRRDIAAKRRILALYEKYAAKAKRQQDDPSRGDPVGRIDPFVSSATRVLGEAVAALAGVYEEAEENAGPDFSGEPRQ